MREDLNVISPHIPDCWKSKAAAFRSMLSDWLARIRSQTTPDTSWPRSALVEHQGKTRRGVDPPNSRALHGGQNRHAVSLAGSNLLTRNSGQGARIRLKFYRPHQ